MMMERQEFMDLKQGGRSMHDYSKLFNHLTQYEPDQVDMDDKKMDCFVIGLSTKLYECMALNTGGIFPEFVSNVMIADDAIYAHKETKKTKAVAAPFGSAPRSNRWCTTTVPHTHLASHSSINTSSGLPAHLSASTSGQCLRIYLHLYLCYVCLSHRLLEPSPATPTSTVVARATSLESTLHRRRMLLKATSLTSHVVRIRWLLQRLAVSTIQP
jgi:hypothetical protein